jgi:hypothetical protein
VSHLVRFIPFQSYLLASEKLNFLLAVSTNFDLLWLLMAEEFRGGVEFL